jgi:hypothetical protein
MRVDSESVSNEINNSEMQVAKHTEQKFGRDEAL